MNGERTVAVLDFGLGNLHSLRSALELGGAAVRIEPEPRRALGADAIVLPGCGALPTVAPLLVHAAEPIRDALEQGFPCLAVGSGMHLLFSIPDGGEWSGLGIPGKLRSIGAPRRPHTGWNRVHTGLDPLFAGAENLTGYFAHDLVAEPEDPHHVIGWTEYLDDSFPAAIRRGLTWGVQFHPEKSGVPGLRTIRNFLEASA